MRIMISVLLILALFCSGSAFAELKPTEGIVIPEVTIKQFDIPENEALALVRDMKLGWNLGNTFDAYDNGWAGNTPLACETYWSGASTTQPLIQALHDAGFNALRLPVSWHDHMDEQMVINETWMNRVKEVAGWALDLGMYVIVNVHHDNRVDGNYADAGAPKKAEKPFYYPDEAHYESSAAYLSAVWQQVAEAFSDCDEHLILESMNEPRLVGTQWEWNWSASSPACLEAMECINRLNQLFVDTVRATGVNNAARYLSVPSYDGNPWYACAEQFRLPEDSAENRLIVEVHAYTPYDFALNQSGGGSFSMDSNSQKSEIGQFMNKLYETYIAKGIPVIIDEFGALDKKNNTQDRVDFTAYYIASARHRGITCFWWDNHNFSGNGEKFGLIDRKAVTWKYPDIVLAALKYCE